MQTTRWAAGVVLSAGALLLSGGCQSSPAGAIATVAADAASKIATAATQPSTPATPTATTTAVKTAPVAASATLILGRWVRTTPFSYGDGQPAPDGVSILVFNKDGSYETSSTPGGYSATLFLRGTYHASGNAITTHLGKSATTLNYKIAGGKLELINPKTKASITYERG